VRMCAADADPGQAGAGSCLRVVPLHGFPPARVEQELQRQAQVRGGRQRGACAGLSAGPATAHSEHAGRASHHGAGASLCVSCPGPALGAQGRAPPARIRFTGVFCRHLSSSLAPVYGCPCAWESREISAAQEQCSRPCWRRYAQGRERERELVRMIMMTVGRGRGRGRGAAHQR